MSEGSADRMESALEGAVQGNSEAFAELVRAHQKMVFSIAYHFLQDRSRAEDVAQEVFLRLFQELKTIQSPAHLTYWLRRVTAHRCIDLSRRQKYRAEAPLEAVAEPATDGHRADPMLLGSLQQSVASLPEKQRMVVILRYQEDLSPDEIAGLLDMPVNTVKSTLHRSLGELRKRLSRKVGEVRYAFY